MNLEQYIRSVFPEGLNYNDAAQLCLRLCCCVDGLPKELHSQCSKEGLALTFAKLSKDGFLFGRCVEAILYGANHQDIRDKGHWMEVATSVLKIGNTVDYEVRDALDNRINRH